MDNTSPASLVAAWGASLGALELLFHETLPAPERAQRLAELLRQLAPGGLAACLLRTGETPILACSAEAGLPTELEQAVQHELTRLDGCAAGLVRLEDLEKPLSLHSQAVAVTHGDHSWGYLLLGQPRDAAAEWLTVTGALLQATARTLALHLHLETESARAREVRDRLAEIGDVALLGDAALMLAHDLNDVLNTMILQASLVQMKVDAQRREELGLIRQQGRRAAGLLLPLQQTWQQRRHGGQAVDLNALVRQVAAESEAPRARLDLAAELPPVPVTRSGLRRLVGVLLRLVSSHRPATTEPILIQTVADGGVRLLVSAAPLAATGEEMPNPFDAEDGLFGGPTLLEGLALQSLLRQSNGKFRVSRLPEGGLAVSVTWQ
jgi:hypothetical protein